MESKEYQKKTQHQHILDIPDTYIGSVECQVLEDTWYVENNRFVKGNLTVSLGLYKIFDEILTNASDQVIRTRLEHKEPTKHIKVEIDEKGYITIENDGEGIPVVEHEEEKVYIPEMIFGQLLTSSNYNEDKKRVVGGKNGYGAKLANIYSREFILETVDKTRCLKYKQVWKNNMYQKKSPKITEYHSKPYTKIKFLPDYARFHMETITEDMIRLFEKRTYDIAGITPNDVSVSFHKKKLPVKTFNDYVNLYLDKKDKRAIYKSDRWEVIVLLSHGSLEHVSFVNGIATFKGGKHVDDIVNKISREICKRQKNKIKIQHVKNNLWVFIRCLIENPTFTSQIKEEMTLPYNKFGSRCELDDKFIKDVEKIGIVERAKMLKEYQDKTGLNKTDGKKVTKIKGLPKLEDALKAGTKDSEKCTLMITEGDSAKKYAIHGLRITGQKYYGVFPIKGKLLNVRDCSAEKIRNNQEIENIKKIIGLQHNKKYTSLSELRYGKILILTDADEDGNHIKGLIMNFIDTFWPELLSLGFLVTLNTPIVKVYRNKKCIEKFYTLHEFRQWEQHPHEFTYQIKYYKGLGTSTGEEAREEFQEFQVVQYQYDDISKDAMQLAFDKKLAHSRKDWLKVYNPEDILDTKERSIKIYDFIHKGLKHFSNYDNYRSIPSFLDGLKPSQRKVIHYCLEHHIKNDIKVAQLASKIASETLYHHGEKSLEETIVNVAQDFVGSNNLPLLYPSGEFGTRETPIASSSRYIYTYLQKYTPYIFRKEDKPLLHYITEENQQIEPVQFLPILPMILINGSHGIGTGYSTHIPQHNPIEIIDKLIAMLDQQEITELHPWFQSFKGTISYEDHKYYTKGIYTLRGNTLHIKELPIGVWTSKYKEHIQTLYEKNIISDDVVKIDAYDVDIKLTLKKNFDEQLFKLRESLSCNDTNMYVYDPNRVIVKFKSTIDMLIGFFKCRLPYYKKRKEYRLEELQRHMRMLKEKIRFIKGIIEKKIHIYNKEDEEVLQEFQKHHFETDFQKKIHIKDIKRSYFPKALQEHVYETYQIDDLPEEEEQIEEKRTTLKDYDYLLHIQTRSYTQTKLRELEKEYNKAIEEVNYLSKTHYRDIWKQELIELKNMIKK